MKEPITMTNYMQVENMASGNLYRPLPQVCRQIQWLVRIPFAIYLVFVAVYLGIQMFQGFSFLDIGMYMMGYKNFVSDPYASYYLGQWIMTYDVTYWICCIFGLHNFMSLRLMHLCLILITQTIIYFYLRCYIKRQYIILGLFMATLAHFGSYTEITYNDYSAFLLMISLMTFHRGVEKNRAWLVVLAGAVAGIAVFFRVVNITYIGIPIVSCIAGCILKFGMAKYRRLLFFYSGMFVGMALIVALLYAQGLLHVLQMTIADIFVIGTDNADTHGMMTILRKVYELYTSVLGNMSAFALFTIVLYVAIACRNTAVKVTLYGISALLVLFVMNFSYYPAHVAMAICLAGLIIAAVVGKKYITPQFFHLFVMSMYMPLVMPVGSNAEPSFYGKELCFLPMPMAIYVLLVMLPSVKGMSHKTFFFRLRHAISVLLVVVATGFLLFNIVHKQMEDGNRLACRYTIDSPLTKGIMTTRENADMYNLLLHKVKPLVPSGSYMICNFSLPAVSLLDCKPWAVYSTVYSTDRMNERYIRVAWEHTRKLPYVLLDDECTLPGYGYILAKLNSIKPYRKIWKEGRFSLYYVDSADVVLNTMLNEDTLCGF